MIVEGVKNIEELVQKTAKPGETIINLSNDVAIRLYDKVGWCVAEMMSMAELPIVGWDMGTVGGEPDNVKLAPPKVGVVMEAPLTEQQLHQVIQAMQAFRVRRR